MNDPIVEEVRRVRDAHAASFDYDLDAIVRDIQEQERKSGRQFVSFPRSVHGSYPTHTDGRMSKVKITQSYKGFNSLNLGKDFIREHQLVIGRRYPITVVGMEDTQLAGTIQKTGLIGGLAAFYKRFPDLQPDAEVEITFDGLTITIHPPGAPEPRRKFNPQAPPSDYVLDRKTARHVYIAPYAPGSLNTWEPKGEPDVYMVFGRLAEFTRYRYCCAASQEVLDKLGIVIEPKPDAILIEQGTDRYLIAEFEVESSRFIQHGHKKEDIDLLVCWTDDVADVNARQHLPKVLCLHSLIAKLVEAGDIEL
jgi:hypothetical protein